VTSGRIILLEVRGWIIVGGPDMTFVLYHLVGMLKAMGWPRKLGLPLLRKEVVDGFIVRMAIQEMAEFAVVLGAKQPAVAIRLLADMFRHRDYIQQPAAELWAMLDATKTVISHPEVGPAEAIARFIGDSSGKDYGAILGKAPSQNFLPWNFIAGEAISFASEMPFAMALVWGIEHPQEALAACEAKHKEYSDRLPEMLAAGLKLDPPYTCPTSDDMCVAIQDVIASFQKEVRPLCAVPPELLALPAVARRITQ
jgi:hypothetical protein